MTKLVFWGTLSIIWVLIIIGLFRESIQFWENLNLFIHSFPNFNFRFSLSHLLNITAFSFCLYFILYSIRGFNVKNKLKFHKRYLNTLVDHDSFSVKILLILLPTGIILFSIMALWNAYKMPEIIIPLIVFTIIISIEFLKIGTQFEAKISNQKVYLFTDEPVIQFSELNEFQQTEVKSLKNITEIGGKEYLSIALNGGWGSGKTSILNGLKDLLENGSEIAKIDKGNCEIIELNLWQAHTPENAIIELENLFAELFNKVYLNVSSRDLAFFSLLAETVNSGLSFHLNKWLGTSETIPTSRDRIEKKLKQVLNHLKKNKVVILIDDLDRIPEQYLNGFLKIICYVTGLENVVTISGINREKILSQLQKTEEITVWADGVTRREMESNKLLKDNGNGNTNHNGKIRVEHRFDSLDNESFLSKIFVVQREVVNSDYHIRKYGDVNKNRILSFLQIVHFEDKNSLEGAILNFIKSINSSFNNYRELKLFFNEVFVYLIGSSYLQRS